MSPSFKASITLEEREDLKMAGLNTLENLFSYIFNAISLKHPSVLLDFAAGTHTTKKKKREKKIRRQLVRIAEGKQQLQITIVVYNGKEIFNENVELQITKKTVLKTNNLTVPVSFFLHSYFLSFSSFIQTHIPLFARTETFYFSYLIPSSDKEKD